MELEAPVAEVDDIQCSAECHDTFAYPNEPEPTAFRSYAAFNYSTSIILDRQRQPTLLRRSLLPGLRAEAESDASKARMRMFVDVSQALLHNSIHMSRRCSRQDSEIAINLKRDFQLPIG
jgi:hypothetical protein